MSLYINAFPTYYLFNFGLKMLIKKFYFALRKFFVQFHFVKWKDCKFSMSTNIKMRTARGVSHIGFSDLLLMDSNTVSKFCPCLSYMFVSTGRTDHAIY